MLVVKPNKRRMRYFRDSPSENSLARMRGGRSVGRVQWGRVLLSVGVAGAVVVGLIVLIGHY
jgi:hypothetical protein